MLQRKLCIYAGLAVEGRRVKCVFPRNESAEGNGSISSKDREQSGRGGGVVGNRRILFLKIFAFTDGGSSHYQDVRKAASLRSSYMVPTHPPWEVSCIEGCIFFTLVLFSYLQDLSSL